MLQTNAALRRSATTDRTRRHVLHLIGILDSKMDAVARHRIYLRIAERRGMRGREQVFRRMLESDREHIEWLKQQISRSISQ